MDAFYNISLFCCCIFCATPYQALFAGDALYDSAKTFRLSELPAFALECLPNRNSLVYGDVYGIGDEAATIFRGTLRYEGMPLFLIHSL